MPSIFQIFTGAPIWVWPLLLLLLLLGLRASRTQEVLIPAYFAIPIIALTNLPTLAALPALALMAWGLAYLCGAVLGYRLQVRWILWRQGLRARLQGEWLSLAVMMVLFWANFINGVLGAVAPALAETQSYTVMLALILGSASGSFLGRPLRVLTTPDRAFASGS